VSEISSNSEGKGVLCIEIVPRVQVGICHDTFQFYRCGDTQMFPEHIGLVHISGIERTDLPPDELREPDRGLVFEGDRVGNVQQLQKLISEGYAGYVSIEPFNPAVQQDPSLASKLVASVDYVRAGIGSVSTKSVSRS
jgi:2-keto-myo-inositol isomerase